MNFENITYSFFFVTAAPPLTLLYLSLEAQNLCEGLCIL